MVSISDGLAALQKGIELVKRANNLEMLSLLQDAREAVQGLREENLALKEQVTALQAEKRTRETLAFDGALYWKSGSEASPSHPADGPYCPRCKGESEKVIPLRKMAPGTSKLWACDVCDKAFIPNPDFRGHTLERG